ncbi:MAG TPA: hypothetical protein GX497_07985 [Bacillus bacterium]|nr:hypothetical protein [Bacillus sp. (in: firmicutes)]
MEGIYFYWFSWLCWVFTTFLMKKCKERTISSFVLLLSITVSNQFLQIAGYSVHASFLVLLLFSFIFLTKAKGLRLGYYLFCSLIITIGYASFQLFELFDPVWLIIDRKWLLAFVMLYLTLMLIEDFYYRVSLAIIGVCNGELLYSFILKKFSFYIEIGDFPFLDALAVIIFFIVSWSSFEKLAQFFEATFHKGKARRVQ